VWRKGHEGKEDGGLYTKGIISNLLKKWIFNKIKTHKGIELIDSKQVHILMLPEKWEWEADSPPKRKT
jgi:hypothetical protein